MFVPDCRNPKVLFDVSETLPRVGFAAFVVVVVLLSFVVQRRITESTKLPPWAPTFFTILRGAGLVLSLLALVVALLGHDSAKRALASGTARIAEGIVEDFHPMGEGGVKQESFSVGGVTFAYSDYIITSGFNRTTASGGPMRAGMRVRVQYRPASTRLGHGLDLEILKLEECESD